MTNTMSLGTVGEWPAGRGDKDEFIATFGQERADRYHEAFWKMDPVADALFTSGHTVKEICLTCAMPSRAAPPTRTPSPRLPPLLRT